MVRMITAHDLLNVIETECDFVLGHLHEGDYIEAFDSYRKIIEISHLGLRKFSAKTASSDVFATILRLANEPQEGSSKERNIVPEVMKVQELATHVLQLAGERIYEPFDLDFDEFMSPIYEQIKKWKERDAEILATDILFSMLYKCFVAEASQRELGEDIALGLDPEYLIQPLEDFYNHPLDKVPGSPFSEAAAILVDLIRQYFEIECSVYEAGANVEAIDTNAFLPALRFLYELYREERIEELNYETGRSDKNEINWETPTQERDFEVCLCRA